MNSVRERILTINLLEQIEKSPKQARDLGISVVRKEEKKHELNRNRYGAELTWLEEQ